MITRFAPSPTGPLHLGHAYSALLAHDMAMDAGGDFLLRIEDIDQSRARPEWESQIYDDLAWLGLWWPQPVMRQSDRMGVYRDKLRWLWNHGYAYACTCSRRDIADAAAAPATAAASRRRRRHAKTHRRSGCAPHSTAASTGSWVSGQIRRPTRQSWCPAVRDRRGPGGGDAHCARMRRPDQRLDCAA